MSVKEKFFSFVGLDQGRRLPPAHLVAIAPGVIVTSTRAEAWFLIRTSNTDTQSEEQADSALTSVIRGLGRALQDTDCHLKIVWARISGADYAAGVAGTYTTGNWQRWVDERAGYIDAAGMPQRYVLLGVTLTDDRQDALKAAIKDATADVLALGPSNIRPGDGLLPRAKQTASAAVAAGWPECSVRLH